MKIEEIAMALIDAFAGGGASLWGKQIACSPVDIAKYGYDFQKLGVSTTEKSGMVAKCTTSIGSSHTGAAGTAAVATYTNQTSAMDLINQGLQGLADKAKGVSEFIKKAQNYLKGLLEKFRLKIIKLLGSWLGMLVVAAVAFLAVKLIKSLINKVASKLGVAGMAIRTAGAELVNSIQQTLTKPKPVQLPDIKQPGPVVLPTSTTPPGGTLPSLTPTVDTSPPPLPPPAPAWKVLPVPPQAPPNIQPPPVPDPIGPPPSAPNSGSAKPVEWFPDVLGKDPKF